jgi:hypothetical protein
LVAGHDQRHADPAQLQRQRRDLRNDALRYCRQPDRHDHSKVFGDEVYDLMVNGRKGKRVQEHKGEKVLLLLFYFFTFSLFYFQCSIVFATVLSTAAASLSPGQWTIVPMSNVNLLSTQFDPTVGAPGPGFDGWQPAWNTHNNKLYFEVGEHNNAALLNDCAHVSPPQPDTCFKKIWIYDDATDTWTVNGDRPHYPNGFWVPGAHVYNHLAWDNVNQVMYARQYWSGTSSVDFFRYCVTSSPSYCATQGAGTWAQIATLFPPGDQVAEALAWHPNLNGGTLVYYTGSGAGGFCGAVFGFRETGGTGTWSTLDAGTSPSCKYQGGSSGGYATLAVYSPPKDLVIFGGGVNTQQFWKINAAGTIAAIDNAPCVLSTTNGGFASMVPDPVSGNIVVIGCTATGQLWQLDPAAGSGSQWTLIDGNLGGTGEICNTKRNPAELCSVDFYGSPITSYGVIGYWKWKTTTTGEYWIYKHSTSGADITPPTGVSVTAPSAGGTVSGSSVTLSANASDNVGVVGVQFKIDGGNVSVEDTASPYSITWDSTTVANGAHLITAVARDAAGNTTTSSAVSVTVTNAAGGGADFATRCIGALFCNGFDTAGDLGGDGWGNARGYGPSDSIHATCAPNPNLCPTIDTTTKVSGAGALKFTIPPGSSGAAAGSYWANPSTDFSIRFGAGQTYYVQFRQRVTASYFPAILTGNGKIHWVSSRPDLPGCTPSTTGGGNCFASCSENEFVNQNNYGVASDALPRWYNGCPGNNTFEFIEPVSPGQYKLQNARTGLGCTYDNVNAGNRFPPTGNCFPYYPDQWVTYSYKISLGSLGTGAVGGRCYDPGSPGSITPNLQNCYYGSQIQARMGLDGQPLEEVLNWTLPVVAKDQLDPTELKYGKVWFSPYTASATIPSGASMWFDELIISTSPIADPGSGGTITPPANVTLTRRRIQ